MIMNPNYKFFLRASGIHLLLLLGVSLVYMALGAWQQLPQFWAGGLLGGLNILVVLWSINRVMTKKPIALTVTASVFKYGFLIAIFWLATRAKVDLSSSFFIGLFLMLPSLGVVLFILNKNGKSWLTSTGHN
jgi:hypothetical protein